MGSRQGTGDVGQGLGRVFERFEFRVRGLGFRDIGFRIQGLGI